MVDSKSFIEILYLFLSFQLLFVLQANNFDLYKKRFVSIKFFLDIDECSTMNPCHDHATCVNTDGSYHCACKSGYSGDGRFCKRKCLIPFMSRIILVFGFSTHIQYGFNVKFATIKN